MISLKPCGLSGSGVYEFSLSYVNDSVKVGKVKVRESSKIQSIIARLKDKITWVDYFFHIFILSEDYGVYNRV